jgi:hypothetical protein
MAKLPEMPDVRDAPSDFGLVSIVWNYLAKEGSVIRAAPVSVIVAVAVLTAVISYYMRSYIKDEYTSQIDDLRASVESLRAANENIDARAKSDEATIDFMDKRISELSSTTTTKGAETGNSRIQFTSFSRVLPYFPVKINIYFVNKGLIPARGPIFAGNSIFSQSQLSDVEIDDAFKDLKLKLKDYEKKQLDYEVQPGDPLFKTIAPSDYTKEQFDKFASGTGVQYTFSLAEYRDAYTPDGKFRVTEVCVWTTKDNNADHFCNHHNRIYVSD